MCQDCEIALYADSNSKESNYPFYGYIWSETAPILK